MQNWHSEMRKMFKRSLFLVIILITTLPELFAQEANYISHSRKAERYFQKAVRQYSKRDYAVAYKFANKATAADGKYVQAYLLAGDIALELKDNKSAITHFRNAASLQPDFFPKAHLILGNLLYNEGNYNEALEYFSYYSKFILSETDRNKHDKRISKAQTASNLKNNPVYYEPVILNQNINTSHNEYINTVSADGSILIFTRRSALYDSRSQNRQREEFFKSELVNGTWTESVPLIIDEDHGNEGAMALSYDNNFLFFTACHRSDGYGSCDIYLSKKNGEQWTKPENLGSTVNSSRWESQPSFSSDGKTLYFASNRSGGYGGSDIWKTVKQENGFWGEPENLGSTINTEEDEMSPFIHADGRTLYFSSKGHYGLGGADLFVSRLNQDDLWSEPLNLGYPINTVADEINLVVHPDGRSAFISTDLAGGEGGYDIYQFELFDEIKPLPVSYVKGHVKDINTLKPLAANIELSDLKSGKIIVRSESDPVTGEFIAVLPVSKNYALHVNHKNYLFYSHFFALDTVSRFFNPVNLNILLKPVEYGQVIILKNVFFAVDSYQLESASFLELNLLVDLLIENPRLKLEISGHTDNTGNNEYNLVLSFNRAKAVFEYLVAAGIDEKRLSYSGKGDTQPVDTNDTPEGRTNNRRTEFKIVE